MALPETKKESEFDDIQSISVKQLSAQYIRPIERLRSMSAPAVLNRQKGKDNDSVIQRDLDAVQVDNSDAQESRAHAFYRMIGLPVMRDDNVTFFNPGFNPDRTGKATIKQANIGYNISQPIKIMHAFREGSAKARRDVFKKSGVEASVHSLVLPIIKPFQVIDTNKSFTEQDNQTFNIPRRKLFLQEKYTTADGELTVFKDSGSHILRPFTVDPIIEKTVMPADRIICEPFLKDKISTRLENDTFLNRPLIESVLRLRLKEFEGRELLEDLITIAVDVDDDVTDPAAVRNAAIALFGDDGPISSLDVSTAQLFNITKYIKTINRLITLLSRQVEVVNKVRLNINWTPISDELGPEFGTDVGSLLVLKNNDSNNSETNTVPALERQQSQLFVKNIIGTINIDKTTKDIGTFAGTTLENPEKTFKKELDDITGQINEFIRQGSKALEDIEIITGEISGLGLVDIIAIYTALWAIDLEVLVAMIDDSAFERLYENNKELRAPVVKTRRDTGVTRDGTGLILTVKDAIGRFEDQVISILSYADKLFSDSLTTRKNIEAGNPTSSGD